MIDRLATGLRELATLAAADVETASAKRLMGDCADAVRLELDCPQQSLTLAQRAALSRLSDALEDSRTRPSETVAAARAACTALFG